MGFHFTSADNSAIFAPSFFSDATFKCLDAFDVPHVSLLMSPDFNRIVFKHAAYCTLILLAPTFYEIPKLWPSELRTFAGLDDVLMLDSNMGTLSKTLQHGFERQVANKRLGRDTCINVLVKKRCKPSNLLRASTNHLHLSSTNVSSMTDKGIITP